MLKQEQIAQLESYVKTIQIICFALIMGVVTATLVLSMIANWEDANARTTVLSIGALAVGLTTLFLSFILPGIISRSATEVAAQQLGESGDSLGSSRGLKQLAGIFQTQTIVRYALIEGGAFLNLIAFFLEVSVINLAFVMVAVVLMVLMVPRGDSLYSWVSDRIDQFQRGRT